MSVLGWTQVTFLNATPKFWLKEYIIWLKANNPDALDLSSEQQLYAADQVPLWN